MFKKNFLKGVTIAAVLSFSIYGCSSTSSKDEVNVSDTIKIGAILPLTGAASLYGESVKNAIDLYMEENSDLNIQGKKLEVVYVDDQNDSTLATNGFERLVNNDKIDLLMGPVTSGSSFAVAPLVNSEGIPTITPTATAEGLTELGGNTFYRAAYNDNYQGEVAAKFLVEDLQKTKIAIIKNNSSDYSIGLSKVFRDVVESLGGEIIIEETYGKNEQDFNAILSKIKSANPEAIYIPDYYNEVGLIAKQARDLGIESILLGADAWDNPVLLDIAGDSINNSYFTGHYSADSEKEKVQLFVKAYEEKYGVKPDSLSALAYDTMEIIVNALKSSTSLDRESITKALSETEGEFITGDIIFGEDRNPLKEVTILKIEDGKVNYYSTVK